ncbi:MAG: sugar phosphate isomerase/epimerase family protein, partial [Planctomycetota bacterium]
FFREAGHRAAGSGVTLCIEPCPGESSRDFVVDSREGLELVRRVDSPGFGLHLDTAAMTLSGEPLPEAIQACCGELRHFHASEPGLRPPGRGQVAHERFAGALRSSGYSGWVSLEMLGDPDGDSLVELRRALTLLRTHYGP